MNRANPPCLARVLAALLAASLTGPGCVSVQYTSANGQPKLCGWGSAKPLNGTQGQIYRIVAPGLSLRIHSYAPGLTLGWSELRLFYPPAGSRTNGPARPVAIQTRNAGINIAPWQIMLGFDRSFAIPLPPRGADVVQFISYSANHPTNTVVQRKEFK